MHSAVVKQISVLSLSTLLALSSPITAETATHSTQDAEQEHSHKADDVGKGYFEDDQIAPRELSDWAGDWQSVFPYLQDGTLDVVMQHKAESGEKTAEEYKAYYTTGYATDVDRIEIDGDTITFFRGGDPVQARYKDDGYEVLTYEAGNRGVRFIFEKVDGDASAPGFIQFSDHHISPTEVGHYHLYWGEDRTALLDELTNWPTYFPAHMSGGEIAAEMQAH
jgi:zinc transport system substrate-binding protein